MNNMDDICHLHFDKHFSGLLAVWLGECHSSGWGSPVELELLQSQLEPVTFIIVTFVIVAFVVVVIISN